MTDVFSSTISGLSCSTQSKGHTRLDAECKGQSLQESCKLFAWKFLFQTQQQSLEQAEEPLSAYVGVLLMPISDHVQMYRPSFLVIVLVVWNSFHYLDILFGLLVIIEPPALETGHLKESSKRL
ncbi:hypothetical protein TNCV_3339011 [Trichonephila clavipes]|nr:hypothetical protein TNCV_3339011 [Trichonephila clavipes]